MICFLCDLSTPYPSLLCSLYECVLYMKHLKLIRLAVLDEKVDQLGCVLHKGKHFSLDQSLDRLDQLINLHEVNILVHGAMHDQQPPLLVW